MAASFDDKVEALKKLREKRMARNAEKPAADTAPVNAWTDGELTSDAQPPNEESKADCEERAAFEGSATGGNADAQYCMGHYAETEQSDFAKAAHWYEQAAEDGHAAAQWRLGHFYENGLGLTQNDIRAAHWYMQASAGGHAQAQFSIAVFLEEGRGMSQDDRSAWHWHRAAAMQGHHLSMFCLGCMYEEGRGTKKSVKDAKEWYAKAVEAGFAPAKEALTDLENQPDDEAEEEELEKVIGPGAADNLEENPMGLSERLAELQAQTSGGDIDDEDFNKMLSSFDFSAMPGGDEHLSELATRVASALRCVDDDEAVHLLDKLMSDEPEFECDDDIQASLDSLVSRGSVAPAA